MAIAATRDGASARRAIHQPEERFASDGSFPSPASGGSRQYYNIQNIRLEFDFVMRFRTCNLQELPFRRLWGLWEWKNRARLEKYYISRLVTHVEDEREQSYEGLKFKHQLL